MLNTSYTCGKRTLACRYMKIMANGQIYCACILHYNHFNMYKTLAALTIQYNRYIHTCPCTDKHTHIQTDRQTQTHCIHICNQ